MRSERKEDLWPTAGALIINCMECGWLPWRSLAWKVFFKPQKLPLRMAAGSSHRWWGPHSDLPLPWSKGENLRSRPVTVSGFRVRFAVIGSTGTSQQLRDHMKPRPCQCHIPSHTAIPLARLGPAAHSPLMASVLGVTCNSAHFHYRLSLCLFCLGGGIWL